jgi:Family of unknown function (DUF5691)
MELRNNIINTALLGTEKKQLSAAELPASLQPPIEQILQEPTDNETKFLKGATLVLNFCRAGVLPLKLQLQSDEAPRETLTYCSKDAIRVLREILSNKYHTLTWYWCKLCSEKNLIVQPHLLPELFEWGVATRKQHAGLFRQVIGERGIWFANFSDEWAFVNSAGELTDWDTATLKQRITYLEQLRNDKPAMVVEKIQDVWKEENAASRVELIAPLAINISQDDEAFLMEILSDKSQKVKEKALQLLKLIPNSELMQVYEQILRDSTQFVQGKMLGLIGQSISIKLKLSDSEQIRKTGIQVLSSDKGISDDDFILQQLIAEVPPSFWEKHLQCGAAQTVKIFASKSDLKKFQLPICNAVIKFKNQTWAAEIMEQFSTAPVQLLYVMDDETRIRHAEKFLKESISEVVLSLRSGTIKDWPLKFTKSLLSLLAENPSAFNKSFYETISLYLPSSLVKELDSLTPPDEFKKLHWPTLAQEIKELIEMKERVKGVFSI